VEGRREDLTTRGVKTTSLLIEKREIDDREPLGALGQISMQKKASYVWEGEQGR